MKGEWVYSWPCRLISHAPIAYHGSSIREADGHPTCSTALQMEVNVGTVFTVGIDSQKVGTLGDVLLTAAGNGHGDTILGRLLYNRIRAITYMYNIVVCTS